MSLFFSARKNLLVSCIGSFYCWDFIINSACNYIFLKRSINLPRSNLMICRKLENFSSWRCFIRSATLNPRSVSSSRKASPALPDFSTKNNNGRIYTNLFIYMYVHSWCELLKILIVTSKSYVIQQTFLELQYTEIWGLIVSKHFLQKMKPHIALTYFHDFILFETHFFTQFSPKFIFTQFSSPSVSNFNWHFS